MGADTSIAVGLRGVISFTAMATTAVTWVIESFQDFMIELDMKPHIHVVEISIFSLNNVTVRLTKIVNNLLAPT